MYPKNIFSNKLLIFNSNFNSSDHGLLLKYSVLQFSDFLRLEQVPFNRSKANNPKLASSRITGHAGRKFSEYIPEGFGTFHPEAYPSEHMYVP